jgi:glutaredoxin-like protein
MQESLISEQDKAQLKRTFRKDLKGQVHLRLFTQRPSPLTIPGRECKYCPQAQQLMEELAGLSPKIDLETVDFYAQPQVAQEYGVTRIPAIVLSSDGSSRIKFYGIPMGYEMATIIEDIKTISRGISPLSMDTRKKLRQVNQEVRIQVFVTPRCPYCPTLARLAHAMALESPRIAADVVEIQEFPSLAQTYGVRSVPLTVINENIQVAGAVPENQLVEKVLQAGVRATPETSERTTK